MTVHAHISLKDGKHTHPPNTVLVPGDRKTFPVTIRWATEAVETYVVAASHREARHAWCVLDDNLRQVMADSGSKRSASKSLHPHVSRALHGGGAPNQKDMTIVLESAKLKNGQTYTLICRLYGVIASTEFVAISAPAPAKKSKKRPGKKKKAAKRTASKKKPSKKKTSKRKPAKKKAARKKPGKKKSAKRKPAKRKPAKRKAAKKKSARKKK